MPPITRLLRHLLRPSVRLTRASPALAGAVLVLSVLNPLACALHCAALEARAQQPLAAHTSSSFTLYHCDMLGSSVNQPLALSAEGLQLPSAPLTITPRAVHEGVGLASLSLALLCLLLASLQRHITPLISLLYAPLTPPPRVA